MTKTRMFKHLAVAVIFPVTAWLAPSCLWGQVPAVAGAAMYVGLTPAELVVEAEAITSLDAAGKAADLFDHAARMMPVEDAQSVALLVRAGRLHYFNGELGQATKAMKDAGWRALGQGFPLVAANAYADAALIAVAQQDKEEAAKLVKIVQLIANWPGLSLAERREIRSRIQ